jgi:hypothetical protein
VIDLWEDLVWVANELTNEPDCADARRIICSSALNVAKRIFPPEVLSVSSADELLKVGSAVFSARTDIDTLCRIGNLRLYADRSLHFLDGTPSPSGNTQDRLLCWLMSIESESIHKTSTSALVNGAELQRIEGALRDCYEVLSPRVRERAKLSDAVVEVCPSSNLMVGWIRGYQLHPAREMSNSNLNLTINSDDPSLFQSFLGEEIGHASLFLDTEALKSALQLSNKVARTDTTRVDLIEALAAILDESRL